MIWKFYSSYGHGHTSRLVATCMCTGKDTGIVFLPRVCALCHALMVCSLCHNPFDAPSRWLTLFAYAWHSHTHQRFQPKSWFAVARCLFLHDSHLQVSFAQRVVLNKCSGVEFFACRISPPVHSVRNPVRSKGFTPYDLYGKIFLFWNVLKSLSLSKSLPAWKNTYKNNFITPQIK